MAFLTLRQKIGVNSRRPGNTTILYYMKLITSAENAIMYSNAFVCQLGVGGRWLLVGGWKGHEGGGNERRDGFN